jgi:hypothetical protein
VFLALAIVFLQAASPPPAADDAALRYDGE